jgi:predicted O-methyltransferase YrrM
MTAKSNKSEAAPKAPVNSVSPGVIEERRARALTARMERSARTLGESAAQLDENAAQQLRVAQSQAARLQRIESLLVQVDQRLTDHELTLNELGAEITTRRQVAKRFDRLDGQLLAVDDGGSVAGRLRQMEGRLEHTAATLDRHLSAQNDAAVERHSLTREAAAAFAAIAQPVIDERRTLLDRARLLVLWQAARNAADLGAPALEAGAYRGGSAYFLAASLKEHLGREVELHVLDTFAGHIASSIGERDSASHVAGMFGDVEREDVEGFLSVFKKTRVHQGDAVETVEKLKLTSLSLVHLDMDLYAPTLALLRRLGPMVVAGGVIVVDDFGAPKCPGIAAAVGEFLADSREPFQLWNARTDQALIVRRDGAPPSTRTRRKTSQTSTPRKDSAAK